MNNSSTSTAAILIVIFIMLSNISSARKYVRIDAYDLTDKDALNIAKEMKKLKLDDFQFAGNQSYSTSNTKYTSFSYQPYVVEKFYEKSIILKCIKNDNKNWLCESKEILKITLDKNKPKTIEIIDKNNIDINVFVDAGKVATNEKPVSINYPVVSISSTFMNEFVVTLAKNTSYDAKRRYGVGAHCNLTLIHSTIKGENHFTVDWDEFAEKGCVVY